MHTDMPVQTPEPGALKAAASLCRDSVFPDAWVCFNW